MEKKIRTREIQKNIKMIDKSAIATGHLKHAYVRTKECAGQPQQEPSSNGSVEYAENKIVSAAGSSARKSVRSIKRLPSFSSAGFKGQMGQKAEVQEGQRQTERPTECRRAQEQTQQKAAQKKAGVRKAREQTEWKTVQEGVQQAKKCAERAVHDGGKKDVRAVFKSGKRVKVFEQPVYKPMKPVQKAQEAAKKSYVESQISKGMTEMTIQNAGYAAKTEGHMAKAGMKTGTSAVRAVIASTKALFTAVTAGGSVTAILLIFIILFGGFLYTVGGGNASAVSQVSKEVEAYEPLIRKYANQYGIGEYVELLKQ